MIKYLHIENMALIDKADISFEKGLSILTGETGAGKSMIIDSLNFVLGERASKDLLRTATDMVYVEALFYLDNNLDDFLDLYGIEKEEDNSILINRTYTRAGKSICRVNGRITSLSIVKELSESLIDIHGQHENRYLLSQKEHINILDNFADIDNLLIDLKDGYNEYKLIRSQIKDLELNEAEKIARIKLLEYEISEIENAGLSVDEEKELEYAKKIFHEEDKINLLTSDILSLLDGEDAILSNLSLLEYNLNELIGFNENIKTLHESAINANEIVKDVSLSFKSFAESFSFSELNIDEIEDRLNKIYLIKKKYSKNVSEVLDLKEKSKKELKQLKNSDFEISELKKNQEMFRKNAVALCKRISDIRKEKAKEIESQINIELEDLAMENTIFKVDFEQKRTFDNSGFDKVEFLISANKGEELKPIQKVASGGELSRIMLAMKTVISKSTKVDSFIFDEIDTGVSGVTAQKVAEKLAVISKRKQVICISHLPAITAMGDKHYLIKKSSDSEKTTTNIQMIDKNESISEIARLLAGENITEFSLKTANELKEFADEYKRKINEE